MISIFIATDRDDRKNWSWQNGADSSPFVGIDDPQTFSSGEISFKATVRSAPMPSIVLSLADKAIIRVVRSIERGDARMEAAIAVLRKMVGACLPKASKSDSICLFVHFGGDSFVEANPRLLGAWEKLSEEFKRTFVCFAISRNGTGENVFNRDWQVHTGATGANKLKLPSTEKEIIETIRKWCETRCPEISTKFGCAPSEPPGAEEVFSETESATLFTGDSCSSSPSEAEEKLLDDMSKLHIWVFGDANTYGGSEERSQKWINEQQAYFKGKGILFRQFESRVIPNLPLGEERMGTVRDAYHGIADILSSAIENASPSDRFVGVLDARLYSNMVDKESGMPSLSSVQGLLILAFPEVMWVPVFKNGEENSTRWLEIALELIAGGFNPMFDGTGVRGALIRNRKSTRHSYNRKDVAVTIDEERHFAELTAYTAFRFGYRAFPVSTERLAKQVLGVESPTELPSLAGAEVSSDASMVVFEDGDIEFPDCDQNGMHFLGTRRKKSWPLLKSAHLRVLATAADPEEQIAWSADKEGAKAATGTSAPPQSDKCKPNMTAREWFNEDQVEDLGGGEKNTFDEWLEKCRRRAFNLFAGGMGGVWSLELVKVLLIIGAFGTILMFCPGFLFLALFLLFVAFGLLRKAMSVVLGCNARIWRPLQIRSQWRFYPKLYTNHAPIKEGILKGEKRCWRFVQKPLGGIFGLRNQCGLPNGQDFSGQLDKEAVKKRYREALNPQEKQNRDGDQEGASRHSASGMTLDIATDLIARARAMKNRGGGVEDAIHAAVLATCAYELLDDKTPALSVEALELRHYCEVMAECEFPGIRAQLDMEDRLIDIHNSMSQICQLSEDGSVRAEMFESGMAAICDNLSDLLRARGRYSEAAFMTRRARYMHRLLLPALGRSFLAYPEWVVRSPWHCAISIAAVVVAFFMYWMFQVNRDGSIPPTLGKTWEVLVCDEPDLSWPGRDKGVQYIVRQPSSQPSDVVIDWEYEVWPAKTPTTDTSTTKELPAPTDQNSSDHSDDVIPEETYSQFVHTMRQIALLHLAFLCAFFWDAMRQK